MVPAAGVVDRAGRGNLGESKVLEDAGPCRAAWRDEILHPRDEDLLGRKPVEIRPQALVIAAVHDVADVGIG